MRAKSYVELRGCLKNATAASDMHQRRIRQTKIRRDCSSFFKGPTMMDAPEIELSNYALAELRMLNTEVARQISVSEKNMIDDARRRVEQIAGQVGFSLEHLLKTLRTRNEATLLYVNPDDETQTWNGRGRKPVLSR
jgi:DNA-binding protein H-NS